MENIHTDIKEWRVNHRFLMLNDTIIAWVGERPYEGHSVEPWNSHI